MDSAPPLLSVHRRSLSGNTQLAFPPPPPPPPPADEAGPAAPSAPASPTAAPAPAPAPTRMDEVLLTVNPQRDGGSFGDSSDAADEVDSVAAMEMVRRESQTMTAARRASATQLQNEANWRRMQAELAATPEGAEEAEDIASYMPDAPRLTLRPSAAQQQQHQTSRGSLARPGLLSTALHASGSSTSSSSGGVAHETASAAEWEASAAAAHARTASPSQSFLSADEQEMMLQLPREFKGAAKLIMPAYLTGPISNVTLPSRLDLLGRRGFRLLGALFPRRVGNSVLGWSPVLTTSWSSKEWKIKMQLFHLPWYDATTPYKA